jgi:hypothetical protein
LFFWQAIGGKNYTGDRNANKILVEKHQGKETFGRLGNKWKII